MGSKVIRNIAKVFKSASGVLFGRVTAGTGKGEELTPSQVRSLLSVSTTAETASLLAAKADLVGGLVPASQLPSYVDDVIEAANQAALPVTGETGKIYVTIDNGKTYRWSGSAYVELTDATAVWGSISGTLSNQTDLNSALSGKAASSHTHPQSDITNLTTDLAAKQATLVSGSNIKTVNNTSLLGSGDITVGLSGTGSVDNAALRAEGTGGATLQNSSWIINDNLTASPNNTVNHACLEATGGTTNVSVSIKPKGTGAFCLAAPDGTTTGGNARGANAVDLCTTRASAAAVAAGDRSVVLGAGTASGQNATAIQGGTASGLGAVIFGNGTASGTSSFVAAMISGTVSGSQAVAFCRDGGVQSGTRSFSHGEVPGYGSGNVTGQNAVAFSGAEATASAVFSHGYYASATRYGMRAHASGAFSTFGDAQRVEFVARNKTTNNTATTLFLDGSSTRLTIPSGKVLSVLCRICGIKSDGSAVANYVRRVVIKNVGGTTSLVGSVETIGTDIEDNASTDVAITADDTNNALQINVTGITSETWRWVAVVEGLEIAYGV